ncbi:MAG TPA: heavy metal translocating P-type ATPase [Bauldia sp.]|nr:heavy metal translocating P-type ATPase [Bauldia sp.]
MNAGNTLAVGSCCTPAAIIPSANRVDPSFVRHKDDGSGHIDFLVPGMHCAACIGKIEDVLNSMAGVSGARANLTSRRVGIDFDLLAADPDAILAAIENAGYSARPFDASAFDAAGRDAMDGDLVRSMAVAGFAAGNIMLLSVSVWSGASDATRELFHWLSALIALPAIAYAGRPFFRSALRSVSAGSLNMDVPISVGVLLAAAMSLYETAIGGQHAYFDAAVSLLFFLLVGRFLDYRMRNVARSAAAKLMSLSARSAMRVASDGSVAYVPIADIQPGDAVQVAVGERVPIDGMVTAGASDIDRSMLTGETEPEPVQAGGRIFAGTLNLTGPLTVRVTARAADTLLAEIVRLMEAAEHSSSRYVRLADRVSRAYAPVVHVVALVTVIGWLLVGAGWHSALTAAVAVLIITCPCALGLAVPAVQVVAGGFLLGRGVMVKDGSALERLAAIDTVVLDKTGTLTEGEPRLSGAPPATPQEWALAAILGNLSRHPLARALARAAGARRVVLPALDDVVERPGDGMEGRVGDLVVRLGRRAFVGGLTDDASDSGSEIWLRVGEEVPLRFVFEDALRADAADTVAALKAKGLDVILLSGDRKEAVARAAALAGIRYWRPCMRPTDKAAFLADLAAKGRRVLMVGDGLNDAPALASAFVSMSPANAADISQAAADIVFTGRKLGPVALTWVVAHLARRIVRQNFVVAIGYNLVAVPVAILGFATPLIAAVAMSTSSILVIANALKLSLLARRHAPKPAAAAPEPNPVEQFA